MDVLEAADDYEPLILMLTPAMRLEVNRIMAETGLQSRGEVFQRAFSLLRIHVDAAKQGRTVQIIGPTADDGVAIISVTWPK